MDAELHRKPTKARPARPRLRGAACRRPRRLPRRDRRVVPRAPQGRSGRRQMRLAAMPAAELQETGRIPPNAHHSMPEYGCRPCSGLDPPSRCKNVSCLCFGLGLAAGAGEVQRAARRPARSEYMQPIRCRASRSNRAAERRRPVARPPRPGGHRGRVAGGGNACRRRKLAPTSPGALWPLTTHVAPPGPRQAAQSR